MAKLVLPPRNTPLFYEISKEEIKVLSNYSNVGYESAYGCFGSGREYIIVDSEEQALLLNQLAFDTDRYKKIKASIDRESLTILNGGSL